MTSTLKIMIVALLTCLCFAQESFAQQPGRLYDLQPLETISGEVISVEQVSPAAGRMGYGTHIILKTNDGESIIHLGPSVYLSKIGLSLAPHDKVVVSGAKVKQDNIIFMIASDVEKDGKIYQLRDKDGLPIWRGGNL